MLFSCLHTILQLLQRIFGTIEMSSSQFRQMSSKTTLARPTPGLGPQEPSPSSHKAPSNGGSRATPRFLSDLINTDRLRERAAQVETPPMSVNEVVPQHLRIPRSKTPFHHNPRVKSPWNGAHLPRQGQSEVEWWWNLPDPYSSNKRPKGFH
ncbi:uncharacterized protein BCR38DRAFT_53423 [Pseudomassariella vexata]|uniref:Uncharacterized protein n=1 Tax=Pseudomassariella vexata TaxID=1141098 RepID=A0A1Y2DLC9_9PEZI|nr:uncharacterized protein BCR38DRAFT_53423 [Pseudomassariella vexata]ORY60090.1 hypothetical protein BCR38DRAFT_53423 [Pseudomassariella vexata]